MERTLHQVHDAEKLFYYFFSENESNNLIFRLVLRSRIDKSILKKALNKTLERYPNFRQTPVLDKDGYLYTVDNNQEADVYAYDPDPVTLASRETNGYLFRVMYEGDTLWISIFHSLCDGSGFKMFARTLLYYYFTYSGLQICNEDHHILTAEVPAAPSELSDPFLVKTDTKAADMAAYGVTEDGVNPFKPTDFEDVFLLPESVRQPDQCRDFGLGRYILNTERLLQRAKDLGTTVDTYIHLLTARTIHENYQVGDKLITGIGTIDMRSFYGNKYLQNHVELFWISYARAFFGLSDSDACDIIRKQFKDPQLQKAMFDLTLEGKRHHFRELFDFPITDSRRLQVMRQVMWYTPDIVSTYFSTNLIHLDLGRDLDPLVAHADIYGAAIFREPVLFILTHGSETSVNLVQRNLSRYFPSKLKETFRREGFLVSARLGNSFETDKLRINQIPTVR